MSDQPTAAVDDTPVMSPYRSSARRASVAVVLLGASTVIAGMQLILTGVFLALVDRPQAASMTEAEIVIVATLTAAIQILGLGVSLATAVAYLAWLSRAVDNVPALGGGRPAASPTWAIAWWFIPFANLGMPYEVVRDLRARMRGDPELSHPPLLVAWWFTFILGQVGTVAVAQAPTENSAQIGAALAVAMGAYALTVCAGILAILVLRDIEAASRARAARVQAGEPMVSGLASDARDDGEGPDRMANAAQLGRLCCRHRSIGPPRRARRLGWVRRCIRGGLVVVVGLTHRQPQSVASAGVDGQVRRRSRKFQRRELRTGSGSRGRPAARRTRARSAPPHDRRWAAPRSLVDVGLVLDRHGLHHGRRGG